MMIFTLLIFLFNTQASYADSKGSYANSKSCIDTFLLYASLGAAKRAENNIDYKLGAELGGGVGTNVVEVLDCRYIGEISNRVLLVNVTDEVGITHKVCKYAGLAAGKGVVEAMWKYDLSKGLIIGGVEVAAHVVPKFFDDYIVPENINEWLGDKIDRETVLSTCRMATIATCLLYAIPDFHMLDATLLTLGASVPDNQYVDTAVRGAQVVGFGFFLKKMFNDKPLNLRIMVIITTTGYVMLLHAAVFVTDLSTSYRPDYV